MNKKIIISFTILIITFVGLGFIIGLDNNSADQSVVLAQNNNEYAKNYLCSTLNFDKVSISPLANNFIDSVNKQTFYGVNPTSVDSTVGCINKQNLTDIDRGSSHEKSRVSILIANLANISMAHRVEAIRIFNCSDLVGSFCDIKTESGKKYKEIGNIISKTILEKPDEIRPFECTEQTCTIGKNDLSTKVLDLAIIGLRTFIYDASIIKSNYLANIDKTEIDPDNNTITVEISVTNKFPTALNFSDLKSIEFVIDGVSTVGTVVSSTDLVKKYKLNIINKEIKDGKLCNNINIKVAITTSRPTGINEIVSISSNSQKLYSQPNFSEITNNTRTDNLDLSIKSTGNCVISLDCDDNNSKIGINNVALSTITGSYSSMVAALESGADIGAPSQKWKYTASMICRYGSGNAPRFERVFFQKNCIFTSKKAALNHCEHYARVSEVCGNNAIGATNVVCNPTQCGSSSTEPPFGSTPEPMPSPQPTPQPQPTLPTINCFTGSDSYLQRYKKNPNTTNTLNLIKCCQRSNALQNMGTTIYISVCRSETNIGTPTSVCFEGTNSLKARYARSEISSELYAENCCLASRAQEEMGSFYQSHCFPETTERTPTPPTSTVCKSEEKKANCLLESDNGYIREAGVEGINSSNYKCLMNGLNFSNNSFEISETSSNPYCNIYCKEDLEYYFPGIGYNPNTGYNIRQGQYATIKPYYDLEKPIYDSLPYLKQARTCLHRPNIEALTTLANKNALLLNVKLKEYYDVKILYEKKEEEYRWLETVDCSEGAYVYNNNNNNSGLVVINNKTPVVNFDNYPLNKPGVIEKTIDQIPKDKLAFYNYYGYNHYPYYGAPGVLDRRSIYCCRFSPWAKVAQAYSPIPRHAIGNHYDTPGASKYWKHLQLSKDGKTMHVYYNRFCESTDENIGETKFQGLILGSTEQYSKWSLGTSSFTGSSDYYTSGKCRDLYNNSKLSRTAKAQPKKINELSASATVYFWDTESGNRNTVCTLKQNFYRTSACSSPPDPDICTEEKERIRKETKEEVDLLFQKITEIKVDITLIISQINDAIANFNKCNTYQNKYSNVDEPKANNFFYPEQTLRKENWYLQVKDINLRVIESESGQTDKPLIYCDESTGGLNCAESIRPKKKTFTTYNTTVLNNIIGEMTFDEFIDAVTARKEVEYFDYGVTSTEIDKTYEIGEEYYSIKQSGKIIKKSSPEYNLFANKNALNSLGKNSMPISQITPAGKYEYKFEIANLGKDNRLLPEFKRIQNITSDIAEYQCNYQVVASSRNICFRVDAPKSFPLTSLTYQEQWAKKEITDAQYKESCCVVLDENKVNLSPSANRMGEETYLNLCKNDNDSPDPGSVCFESQVPAYLAENPQIPAEDVIVLLDVLEGKVKDENISEEEFAKQCCLPEAEAKKGMGTELYNNICDPRPPTGEEPLCFKGDGTQKSLLDKYNSNEIDKKEFSVSCCTAENAKSSLGTEKWNELCGNNEITCILEDCPDFPVTNEITCTLPPCGKGDVGFYERIISNGNLNPNKRRLGKNWMDIKGYAAKTKIEEDADSIYLNKPMYSFVLTGTELTQIKADTRSKLATNNVYSSLFEMKCNDKGEHCISDFVTKYATSESLAKSRSEWLKYSYTLDKYIYEN